MPRTPRGGAPAPRETEGDPAGEAMGGPAEKSVSEREDERHVQGHRKTGENKDCIVSASPRGAGWQFACGDGSFNREWKTGTGPPDTARGRGEIAANLSSCSRDSRTRHADPPLKDKPLGIIPANRREKQATILQAFLPSCDSCKHFCGQIPSHRACICRACLHCGSLCGHPLGRAS